LVEEAYARNQSSFERDILQQRQNELTLCGYELKEYAASVYSLASYFEANMALLDPAVRAQVFLPARRIYTKVRDCAPAQYGLHSSVSDSLVGDGAVIGNSTELKNCILFDGVQVPHFNYVGDSVLGYRAHLGAGAITSNVKSDHTDVTIRSPFFSIDTGRRKLGAILGDRVEIGCNTVLNPGTVVGRESTVYPCQSVRGYIEQGCIWRGPGNVIGKK
jgi:ADP-glucose pyrophosphorylase